jgi:hypothetical protein
LVRVYQLLVRVYQLLVRVYQNLILLICAIERMKGQSSSDIFKYRPAPVGVHPNGRGSRNRP